MKNQLASTDANLLRDFESCALTPAQLPHRAHLRLAFIYLTLHPFDVALPTMRARLVAFLEHHGAPAAAYHETLTHAWLLAVRHFMKTGTLAASSEEFLRRCPALLDKEIMLSHYTAEHLMSDAARENFVAPDRDPIPVHPA